jgi:hypothetical protein
MKKPLDQTFKQLENLELKPSVQAWERIQAEIGEDKRRRFGAWYGVAAAAALFVTAYSGYHYLQQGSSLVVPANLVTMPTQVVPNVNNNDTKILVTPQPGITNQNNETIAIQKTATPGKFTPKSAPMPMQIPAPQEFVQSKQPFNTPELETVTPEAVIENEKIEVLTSLSSLPFENLNSTSDAVLCALPDVIEINKNQSVLENISTKMANSTCREVPEDATLSERLLAFADCKTRALIKKVDTNVVSEYKHLRGY